MLTLKITACQISAARAGLGWDQGKLAKASNVGIATIRRIESSRSALNLFETFRYSTLSNVIKALADEGVILFWDENLNPCVKFS